MGKKSASQSQQNPQNATLLPNPNPSSAPNSRILRFDSIIKKGEDDKGNIYYKIKWKDLPKEEASYEPIENLSEIKNEMKEYQKLIKRKRKILNQNGEYDNTSESEDSRLKYAKGKNLGKKRKKFLIY